MNPTRDELYERAQALEIEGRSDMDKEQLEAAVAKAEAPPEEEAPVEEAAPVPSDPLRHTPGATTPKTGPVPPPGVPTEPVHVPPTSRSVGRPANRSADRIGAKVIDAAERREDRLHGE